jgi:hypothetical protein
MRSLKSFWTGVAVCATRVEQNGANFTVGYYLFAPNNRVCLSAIAGKYRRGGR